MPTVAKSPSEYHRAWYLKNRERRSAQIKAYHQCNPDRVREWASALRRKHPDRQRTYQQRYRDKDPERHRQLYRKLNKEWEAKNREARLASRRERWAALPIEEQERLRAQQREYYRANKLRFFHAVKVRNLRKQQVTVNPSGILEWMTVVKSKPTAVCYYCLQVVSTKSIHFDHVVALAVGGEHSLSNLAVSCRNCNLSKNKRRIYEWNRKGQQILSL